MNTRLADLNLLRVFLTIWEERSLTDAGQRLGLTQPAVSHALRRLRDTFNDPLFVRSPNGMVPTETAMQLYPPINEAIRIIQRAVKDRERFDPLTDRRVFRLSMSDVSEFYFLPRLMTHLKQAAPHLRLEIAQFTPATIALAMRTGAVDLTIGFVPGLEDDIDSYQLMTDTFVCLVRAGHPVTRSKTTPQSLTELEYVYADTNATGHRLIEQWLTETGFKRQIVLQSGHFTVAPSVVRDTDLAVIYPKSVARMINRNNEFALLDLPPDQPTVEIMIHTHISFRGDLGIRWLREAMIGLFAQPNVKERHA